MVQIGHRPSSTSGNLQGGNSHQAPPEGAGTWYKKAFQFGRANAADRPWNLYRDKEAM
jgi:hypothetical protein